MPTKKKRKRKPKHGGARPGAGRPVTTGTGAAKPLSFKVAPGDRERGESLAAQQGIGVNELAKRAYLEAIKPPPDGT